MAQWTCKGGKFYVLVSSPEEKRAILALVEYWRKEYQRATIETLNLNRELMVLRALERAPKPTIPGSQVRIVPETEQGVEPIPVGVTPIFLELGEIEIRPTKENPRPQRFELTKVAPGQLPPQIWAAIQTWEVPHHTKKSPRATK